jgi:endonuclease YncB( thermonuclease family)
MDYRIEILDPSGRRLASYGEVPLLEAVRNSPDRPDTIRGIVPDLPKGLEHGCRVRVWVAGRCFCDALVTRIAPQWGDTRKLILDRYVAFHEVFTIEAERAPDEGNAAVSRTFTMREIGAMVKELVNRAAGRLHYAVDHRAYPDGARREYEKFTSRKAPSNQLALGGITAGQWVGASRIDASQACAVDGDTISGLVVDGKAWPNLRLMMIDSEELTRNAHAIERHPQVAVWTDAQYLASGYRLRAEASQAALQRLLSTKGIAYIELNPHRDGTGAFDDRVDGNGRYLGLVYGGDECFNAALVEQGHAEVYLRDEGRRLDPDMQLKDFFSYAGITEESVETTGIVLESLDFQGGVLEGVDALAYAAGGYVWSVGPDLRLSFRHMNAPDRVVVYRPDRVAVSYGSDSGGVKNTLQFEGSPFRALLKTYGRNDSIAAFGAKACSLSLFSLSQEGDADRLATGILNDVAYPTPLGFVTFLEGDASLRVGDVVELRGEPLRRFDAPLPGEWGGRFAGRAVGRVASITQRFSGRQVTTIAELTSPLRTVRDPLNYLAKSQPAAETLFRFTLDDANVGLDEGYHLD